MQVTQFKFYLSFSHTVFRVHRVFLEKSLKILPNPQIINNVLCATLSNFKEHSCNAKLLHANSKINQIYKYNSCDSHKTLLVPNEETVQVSSRIQTYISQFKKKNVQYEIRSVNGQRHCRCEYILKKLK